MQHIISATVLNKPGVLARVAGLFSARGFNITSLTVGETEDPERSRMTVVVDGDDAVLEQVRKQLRKLIDTIKVQDYRETPCVDRDLVLIKVHAPPKNRSQVMEVVDVFRGRVVNITESALIVEVSGNEEKVSAFVNVIRPFGIKEMVRTGRIAMARAD